MTNYIPPFIWQIEARTKAQTSPNPQTVNTYLVSATLVLHTIALVYNLQSALFDEKRT